MKISRYCFCLLLMVAACHQKSIQPLGLDTPTAGHINITVDASVKPLIQAEIQAFQAIYPNASIKASYVPEAMAVQSFLKDSARLVILGRKLWSEEEAVLDTQKIIPQQAKAAIDGIAVILNRDNPDSLLALHHLREVLKGNLSLWKQIHTQNSMDSLQVVFDHAQSGIVQWMMDSLAQVDSLPLNCFAVKSNEEVIQYVMRKPQAIGFIGVSWISDQQDSVAHRFLQQVSVASLASDQEVVEPEFFQPFQAYLAQKKYPLTREIYLISREARAGLANGFMAFVCGDKGQRIVLKSGLVPATMPVRIVKLSNR